MNELQPQRHNDSCLDMGLLVSLRDGELSAEQAKQAQEHLALCPDCAADERTMRAGSAEVSDLLAVLAPSPDEIPETMLAFSALQARLETQEQREQCTASSIGQSQQRTLPVKRQRSRWWLAAVAAALIALLLLPNAGALANQFLALFRVQQFQPVSINPRTFRSGIEGDLQSFGDISIQSDNLSTIQHPTQQQVQQYLSFKLLQPAQLPTGVGHVEQFTLINRAYGTFTFSAAKTRAYLAKTGQGNVSIPAQLAGATYAINLAPGVIINYGTNCQSKNQNVSGSSSSSQITALGCSGGKPFYIAEIPSPVIQATGKGSLQQLRDFVLSLPKLSSGERALLQDINLDNGVVPLPIPPQVNAQQVTVQGAPGVLMTDSSMSLGAAIWQTHGIIYVAAGATSNGAEILNCANSLH